MLDIFGPAGPSMYPDQIFCYSTRLTRLVVATKVLQENIL